MRSALLSASLLTLATSFACSTFSDAVDAPVEVVDAGSDVGTSGGACNPVLVDPAAPQGCTSNLDTDPMNCGICGNVCVGTTCVNGHCAADRLTDPMRGFAVDGATVYGQVGFDIVSVDLAATPIEVKPFFNGIMGDVTHLDVFGGELFVSTTMGQYVITLSSRMQRENAQVGSVTQEKKGIFFAGTPPYYLYANDNGTKTLARIDSSGTAALKNAPSFEPVVHAGGDLYWTTTLSGGSQIFGPWESDQQPFAIIGKPVKSFLVDGSTLFFAAAGNVTRVDRTATGATTIAKLAIEESGTGVAFAVDGPTLFYAVERATSSDVRDYLFRIDKCNGGRPVPLFDINVAIRDVFFIDADHVMINTEDGIYRVRR